MKNIQLQKHSAIPGAWVASIGKRKVSIVQSNLAAALNLVPLPSDVIEAFNSTTRPGDRLISVEDYRINVLAA